MKTSIEVQQLILLISVVQRGGFTAAAKHLGTDKGYVSRSVSRMEDRLGITLLNRTTRKVTPTSVGQAFYERALSILRDLDNVEKDFRATANEPAGQFRITTAPEFGRMEANKWFQILLQKHPKLNLEVFYVNQPVDIYQERIDVAIRLGRTGPSELITTKLGSLNYGIYASQRYLKGFCRIENIKDLEDKDLIMFQPQGTRGLEATWSNQKQHVKMMFWQGSKSTEIRMPVRFRSNNVFATRQMCLADKGICVIPCAAADLIELPATSTPGLVRLLPDWSIEPTAVNLVYPPSGKTDPRMRSLIEIARKSLRKTAHE